MAINPNMWLREQYLVRRNKNKQYSLRAFARAVGIPSGRMSQLLSEKRRLTLTMANRIATALELSPSEKGRLIAGVASLRRMHVRDCKHPFESSSEVADSRYSLASTEFAVIANPIHFSILSLIKTKSFKSDIKWIALRLKQNVVEVRNALNRLQQIGLIEVHEREFVLLRDGVRTSTDIPSSHLRAAHQIILKDGAEAIEDIPTLLRDITAVTVTMDRDRLHEMKELIAKFRQKLTKFAEAEPGEDVYRLAIQFYPITKPIGNIKE